MRVGIIGLGYVGLTLGVVAADSGNDVYGVEINPYIKECLAENRAHFFEPGLDQTIERINGKTFHCVDEFPQDAPFDIFVITVGTPLLKNSKNPNMDYIASAVEAIKPVFTGNELVILRSTVSVGTTRDVVIPLLSNCAGIAEEDVLAAMCPERTVEGKAIQELTNLPQIVGGNNLRSIQVAEDFFHTMTDEVVIADSLEEAELDKLFCNTFRDMTFAIANAFCDLAQNFGVDGIRAIEHAKEGYARAPIPLPGFVAGPCLEKDAYIMTHNAPDCLAKSFILDGRAMNESLEDIVVNWVERNCAEGATLALTGMAFKGVPETNDLRGSSSVRIAEKLADKGYRLKLHDYVSSEEELKQLELGEVCPDIASCCVGADAMLALNNHPKYSELTKASLGARLSAGQSTLPVLDTWSVCTELGDSDDVQIYTLGNIDCKRGTVCTV